MEIPPLSGVLVDELCCWRPSFDYLSASVQAVVVVEAEVHLVRLDAMFLFAEVVAEVVEMVPLIWKSLLYPQSKGTRGILGCLRPSQLLLGLHHLAQRHRNRPHLPRLLSQEPEVHL